MNGSIRQRSKGTWQIRYEGLADTAGMRKYLSETIQGTKGEAGRILRERLAALENGSYVPKRNETTVKFMYRWLSTYAATNTTLSTQQGYGDNVKR